MKQLQIMEKHWGVQPGFGTTLEDRITQLIQHMSVSGLKVHPVFHVNDSFNKRINTLWNIFQKDIEVTPNDQKPVNQNLEKFQKFLENNQVITYDTQNMLEVIPYILQLQAQKSTVYGRSYCRHGDLSIFFNLERKWDRISNIMNKAIKDGSSMLFTDKSGTATETFMDTIVDLTSYGLLWVGYIKEKHPEVFQKFLDDNKLKLD